MRPGRACIWRSGAAGHKVSGFSQAGLNSGFLKVGPMVLGPMVSRHITSGDAEPGRGSANSTPGRIGLLLPISATRAPWGRPSPPLLHATAPLKVSSGTHTAESAAPSWASPHWPLSHKTRVSPGCSSFSWPRRQHTRPVFLPLAGCDFSGLPVPRKLPILLAPERPRAQ